MHITTLEELKIADENLRSALTRYVSACSSIRDCVLKDRLLQNIPPHAAYQIPKEVVHSDQHEIQLRDAKLAIKMAFNSTWQFSPVSALPPEVLSHIFHLIPGLRPCTVDSLAHVCSKWRAIDLSSCSLWTQIVYRPQEDLERLPKLLDRVQTHLSRSDPLLLQVNLCFDKVSEEWHTVPTVSLFSSIGARMQTLELDFVRHKRVNRAQAGALRSLLLSCTNGLMTKLVTRIYGSDTNYYIRSFQDEHNDSPVTLDMSTNQLDSAFSSIEELHTQGIHPRRNSTVYRGLVDLRLASAKPDGSISRSRLLTILRASPRLRTFHFGMVILGGDLITTSPENSGAPASPKQRQADGGLQGLIMAIRLRMSNMLM